ncbi:hypothetical protein ACLM44_12580 [Synechococcus sp. W2B2]|uniref:hypothetical protein n=1 Tax=unclassified Synechococcus TaxID=2626047 RepID=UPI00006BB2F1|nr:hypothetical protein [Synechococcus sp. WH 7805]EAR19893.1 hypothetical protein WH7805_13273 [Synechococcus sp. WH 7805]
MSTAHSSTIYFNGYVSAPAARAALNQLLATLLSPALAVDNENLSAEPGSRIDFCIERVKVEASMGTAFVA